jgi:hypothetical protein
LKPLKIKGRVATNSGRFNLTRRIPNHPKANEPEMPNEEGIALTGARAERDRIKPNV